MVSESMLCVRVYYGHVSHVACAGASVAIATPQRKEGTTSN